VLSYHHWGSEDHGDLCGGDSSSTRKIGSNVSGALLVGEGGLLSQIPVSADCPIRADDTFMTFGGSETVRIPGTPSAWVDVVDIGYISW